jgi:hypothetical protein
MKQACPCATRGADGTTAHNEPSGVTFERVTMPSSTVEPCRNHLAEYDAAPRTWARKP